MLFFEHLVFEKVFFILFLFTMKKNLLFFTFSFCAFFTSCSDKPVEESVDNFQIIYPSIKDTSYTNEYVAEIESIKYVEVRTKTRGFIEKVHVDEGQFVQQGQLLFSISNKMLSQELQQSQAVYKNSIAELKAAEVEWANTQKLTDKNIVSKSELELAEARVEALKAKVEEAQASQSKAALHLSFSHIRAPYSGLINRLPHKNGSLVQEGDILTTISDNREVFAYFNLSEADYLNYITNKTEEKQIVRLLLANNTFYDYEGKVETIESEFDQSTGNIAFRARFPNPQGFLKHGANGKIVIKKDLKNAMLVPQKSTFEIQDMLYVYALNKDSVLEQKNIVPKMRIPHYYIVASGISEQEPILYEGVQSVTNGQKISAELISTE